MTISLTLAASDGCRLHLKRGGSGPVIVLCHGFPDYWRGWRAQIETLSRRFTVIAPDGRGCNLSGKPQDISAYRLDRLAADLDDILDAQAGDGPVLLVGHDWGGAVAWTYAATRPERLAGLCVLSAPHPAILAAALQDDTAQRRASAYMPRLREPGAEGLFEAHDYRALRGMLDRLRSMGLSDDADEAAYIGALSRPGALTGALNWYRANPMEDGAPSLATGPVTCPVELLWGDQDEALLPSLAERHRSLAPDLTIRMFEGAGHWLQRERAESVSAVIAAFADKVFMAGRKDSHAG